MAGDALGYILTKGNGKVNMVQEEERERERGGIVFIKSHRALITHT